MRLLRSLAALTTLAALPAYAAPPKIEHQTLTCIPAKGNVLITAKITPDTGIESFRAYFRWSEKKEEYYLELRRAEAGEFWTVLPIPTSDNKSTHYRLVVRDLEGQEGNTEEIQVPVTKDCEVRLTDEEERAAKNLVIGKTLSDQTTVPPGFECKGIISQITVEGVLKPNTECQTIPPALWLATAGAAATGGALITTYSGGGPGVPVSPSRPRPAPVQRSGGN